MKHPLEVVGQADGSPDTVTLELDVGATRVTISEVGDGHETQRFAELLKAARPKDATKSTARRQRALQIVIRTGLRDRDAVRRQNELEAKADVVLGSARPAFAMWLARSL